MIKIEREHFSPKEGWTYVDPQSGRVFNNAVLWNLRDQVQAHKSANGWGFSEEEFRQNVCSHSPFARCFQKTEAGDVVALVAQPIARAIDAVAASVGVKTNVAGCGGCKKRREKLNQLSEALRGA